MHFVLDLSWIGQKQNTEGMHLMPCNLKCLQMLNCLIEITGFLSNVYNNFAVINLKVTSRAGDILLILESYLL